MENRFIEFAYYEIIKEKETVLFQARKGFINLSEVGFITDTVSSVPVKSEIVQANPLRKDVCICFLKNGAGYHIDKEQLYKLKQELGIEIWDQ